MTILNLCSGRSFVHPVANRRKVMVIPKIVTYRIASPFYFSNGPTSKARHARQRVACADWLGNVC